MKYILGVFTLFSIAIFSGCGIGENETEITCGIAWDPDLLDNPPGDSVYIQIRSNDLPELNRSWSGIIDQELSDSLDAVAYTNLQIRTRSPNNVAQLNGIGTQVNDTSDQTFIRISFDFIESTTIQQACRFNKTIRDEHSFSDWINGNEGARIDLQILTADGPQTYTSSIGNNDGNQLIITGARILDENNFFGMLRGSFTASMFQSGSSGSDPVIVNGEFQYVAQISNGIVPF